MIVVLVYLGDYLRLELVVGGILCSPYVLLLELSS